jgi:hypothetical protein
METGVIEGILHQLQEVLQELNAVWQTHTNGFDKDLFNN